VVLALGSSHGTKEYLGEHPGGGLKLAGLAPNYY